MEPLFTQAMAMKAMEARAKKPLLDRFLVMTGSSTCVIYRSFPRKRAGPYAFVDFLATLKLSGQQRGEVDPKIWTNGPDFLVTVPTFLGSS
jgi:hypothetical protein